MNILIVGEFSGFAKHLKNGFQQLGHSVIVVQTGDGWKKLGSPDDIMINTKNWIWRGIKIKGSNRIVTIFDNIRVDRLLNKCYNSPDLVIVINFSFIREKIWQAGVSRKYVKNCLSNGAKLIMSECGNSCAGAFNSSDYYKLIGSKTAVNDERYTFLFEFSDVIIPTCYTYYSDVISYAKAFGYNSTKISRAIPLPITIDDEFKFSSCIGRKIVVFHGVIRPISKGTEYINQAMIRLQAEMPDKVECISCGGMPYDEYLKLFEKVDVLVDQCRQNGWGMNAIIGAMKGKCVLAPCGPENGENMGIDKIPFVRIGPDSEQIYNELKELVLAPYKIDQIKLESRKFAELYCDCKKIAQRYIDAINKNK